MPAPAGRGGPPVTGSTDRLPLLATEDVGRVGAIALILADQAAGSVAVRQARQAPSGVDDTLACGEFARFILRGGHRGLLPAAVPAEHRPQPRSAQHRTIEDSRHAVRTLAVSGGLGAASTCALRRVLPSSCERGLIVLFG